MSCLNIYFFDRTSSDGHYDPKEKYNGEISDENKNVFIFGSHVHRSVWC